MFARYELRDEEIAFTRLRRKQSIWLQDIRTWQEIYIGGGIPFICIHFIDGRKADFNDPHEQLYEPRYLKIIHHLVEHP